MADSVSAESGAGGRPVGRPRAIRVFVCSTFRDMEEERDELAKRTFPALRRVCESRGVGWSEVDLRWGVPDEDVAEGQVLPICLEEIDRCRPFFIGLLGERYGSTPENVPPELIEHRPWLADLGETSITELEILHGVLRDADHASRSFFYFRDPNYISRVPPERQRDFVEEPLDQDVRSFGATESQRRAARRRARLDDLKQRIRAACPPDRVREAYSDPQALGQLVLEDFTRLVDELFPAAVRRNPLDRETEDHDAFGLGRRVAFVERAADIGRLDDHAAGVGPPLCLVAESGAGKSALLANWSARRLERHPDERLLLHFAGATPHGASSIDVARRIVGEFNRWWDLGLESPTGPHDVSRALGDAFHRVSTLGRVVLVIDGIDRLADDHGALELDWLPAEIPPSVRVILSTVPGRPSSAIAARKWITMAIAPLTEPERRQLVTSFMAAKRGGRLGAGHLDRITEHPATAHPLFLRILLEELRVVGLREQLSARIDHYLEARNVAELLERVLARWERDYDRERPGLVRDSLSLLWAARRGLSEPEILELLGGADRPLPQAIWSPFHLAAYDLLADRAGLLGFFHDALRHAVEQRFLRSNELRAAAHRRIALRFETRRNTPRAVQELAWQWTRAGEWDRLFELLSDLEFVEVAWYARPDDVLAAWAAVEANSPRSAMAAYRGMIAHPERSTLAQLHAIGVLLGELGNADGARRLRAQLVQQAGESGEWGWMVQAAMNLAVSLERAGDLDQALELLAQMERIQRAQRNPRELSVVLRSQARIHQLRGDLDRAESLLGEVDRSSRERADEAETMFTLEGLASLVRARGDGSRALSLFKDVERYARRIGHRSVLGRSLHNQAMILLDRVAVDEARTLLEEEERICRGLGNPADLQSNLKGQSIVRRLRGDSRGALELLREQERLCRLLGDPLALQDCLGNQAIVLGDLDEAAAAMRLLDEQERICSRLGYRAGLAKCLGSQATLLVRNGDTERASVRLTEQERIAREIGDGKVLEACLGNQTKLLRRAGRLDEAMQRSAEREFICRSLDLPGSLARTLLDQAVILCLKNEPQAAMGRLTEQEAICRRIGDQRALAECLGQQAVVRHDLRELDEAVRLLQEQESLARRLGDSFGISRSLGNRALILLDRNDRVGAQALLDEVESICRATQDAEGLAMTLLNKAVIRSAEQPDAQCMVWAEEALALARRARLEPVAVRAERLITELRSRR